MKKLNSDGGFQTADKAANRGRRHVQLIGGGDIAEVACCRFKSTKCV
jgi:hypothetical protein